MLPPSEERTEFEIQATAHRATLVGEFWEFLKYSKKWWLLPILVAMLFLGALVILSSTAAAPFIYTLF